MNTFESPQQEKTLDSYDVLLDKTIDAVQKIVMPEELKMEWIDHLENAESLNDLQKRVDEINYKIERRLALKNTRFVAPKENEKYVFAENFDDSHTKEVLNTVVSEALSGKYEKAGEGMSATVFISNTHPNICYKIITDPSEYEKCVNVKEEMTLLNELSEINVNGVRVPTPYYYHMSADNQICVMETLNAASLQEILEKKKTLPKDFDIEKRFADLRDFFTLMHEKYNIHHQDFHEGNIMFDLVDGTIYVIDFGKAVRSTGSEGDLHQNDRGITTSLNDNYQLQQRYLQLKRFLQKNKSIDK